MEIQLNEHYLKQLNSYLTFFKNKREETLKEINLDLADFLKDNLQETIYNKEDVEDLLKKLTSGIKKNVENDLSQYNSMSAVYVKLLMLQAQEKQIEFSANLNLIEDIKSIEMMKSLERGEGVEQGLLLKQSEKKGKFLQGSLGNNPLGKLSNLMTGQDEQKKQEMLQELEMLKKENQLLQADLATSKLVKDKQQAFNSNDPGEIQDQIALLQQDNKLLKEEMSKKLNESTQFNNLKKMIQTKNEQIKDLKARLSKYEKVE